MYIHVHPMYVQENKNIHTHMRICKNMTKIELEFRGKNVKKKYKKEYN